MDELAALRTLITAADGRATPEPVIGLAIAVGSPWAGDRREMKDGPNRFAPPSPASLLSFVAKARPELAESLPQDRGWLGWLRHTGLAMPLADVYKGPAWLRDPVLDGGWLALPPRGGFNGLDGGTIVRDGRLALLHILATQAGAAPRDAVQALTEWCVGERAADWSLVSADQCPTMAFPPLRKSNWHRTFRSLHADEVTNVICGVPVAATWTRPPLTEAERETLRQRDLRRLAARENAAAWRKPPKPLPSLR